MSLKDTKLTVKKTTAERVSNLLGKKKIDLSITQFTEHVLLEACDAIENTAPPIQLPTITWLRQKTGKDDFADIVQRVTEIEQFLRPVAKKSA